MRILVVEDNGLVNDLLAKGLQANGYSVVTAHSGIDALSTLKQATVMPDLVLLDMGLPIMDGNQFLVEKQGLPSPENLIPVVLFTADSGAQLETACFPDVVSVIHKPADMETILAVLGKYLPDRRSA